MKVNHTLLLGLLCVLFITACTPQRKLIYMKNIEPGTKEISKKPEYTLTSGDLLSINVYSANEKATQLFSANRSISTSITNEVSSYLYGFVVSDSGDVNLPLAGKIAVAGLSLENAAREIEEVIKEYFFDAVVDVKLMSFQVTILGEVVRPGTYRVLKPQLNVLEAISLAGDLNVYGKREITLLRESNNSYNVIKINLNDKNLVSNDFFYLLPNDIIYVEPHKAKSFGANTVPVVFSTLLSSFSIILIIFNFLQ